MHGKGSDLSYEITVKFSFSFCQVEHIILEFKMQRVIIQIITLQNGAETEENI